MKDQKKVNRFYCLTPEQDYY